jgi:hypothetical protein
MIHEARGFCWHDIKNRTAFNYSNGCDATILECTKCRSTQFLWWVSSIDRVVQLDAQEHEHNWVPNTDYHTWPGFGEAWNFAKEQEWWDEFFNMVWGYHGVSTINPLTLAPALAAFLKARAE